MLLDTGHCAAAGFDYRELLKRYGNRIVHIHLKDVRADVMRRARRRPQLQHRRAQRHVHRSRRRVDYAGIADFVRRTDYAGWIVVEAEQDPVKAPPLATVTRARRFIAGLLEQGK